MEEEKSKFSKGFLFKQSSELEILISAAIVFAAINFIDVIPSLISTILNFNISNNSPVLVISALVGLFLSTLLPISVVTHFIFRFYWLSLLGLKTAFERQRLEKLRYANRYMEKLNRRNNLDAHLEFVDKLCSSIFAFSFLTVFVFCLTIISVSIISGIFIFFINRLSDLPILQGIFNVLLIVFIIMCIASLFDFFSLGGLKKIKKKWFVKVYYPINKIMGFITLSWFYKGLYYTFITNIPNRITLLILPLYLCVAILLLNSGFYQTSIYVNDGSALELGESAAFINYYQENFHESTVVQHPFIPAYYQRENFLPLYIPITEQMDDSLIYLCKDVFPIHKRGLHWRKYLNIDWINKRDLPNDFDFKKNAGEVLMCFENRVSVELDGMIYENLNFRFFTLPEPEKICFLTTLDLTGIPKGDHVLKLKFDNLGIRDYEIGFYKAVD